MRQVVLDLEPNKKDVGKMRVFPGQANGEMYNLNQSSMPGTQMFGGKCQQPKKLLGEIFALSAFAGPRSPYFAIIDQWISAVDAASIPKFSK